MIDEWMEQFTPLAGRFESMKKALTLLHEMKGTTILETGTTRMQNDWGAGMSTFVFGAYCKEFGGHVTTIDLSPQNMEVCKEVTKDYSEFINYVVSDSLVALNIWPNKIDLLYLDSVDCPIEVVTDEDRMQLIFAQSHQLNEIKIGLPKVSPGGIVLLDDNAFTHGGKTALTKMYLEKEGWKEIHGGQQSLWIR